MGIVLTLGRDGMGSDDGDEAAFDAWTSYVCSEIDAATGLDVTIEIRGERDVQSDDVTGADEDEAEMIMRAKNDLWDAWCSEDAGQS